MEFEKLKDSRTEPVCRVCGQPESRHQDLLPLHPFEPGEPPQAVRDAQPEELDSTGGNK